jgi:2-oxoisovalerate dehydrogenase E1 component alpha subunit
MLESGTPGKEAPLAAQTKQQASSRHAALGLTDQDLFAMYRTMITARLCDDAQFRLNRQGKAPFVVPVSGHEGCQIGSAWPFVKGKDVFVPYYRDMGICLVAGMGPRDVFLGVFGKRDDPSSGGRQMPAHWGSRRLGIPTGSSPIATQIPHAAGIAYAIKYRGQDAVVGCWFGDGATSEGDWHEGLNFSGIHELPIVWYCENNKYAISVPLSKQMAVKNVADRAVAYGFEGVIVEGNDVLACYEASKAAIEKARSGGGPTLIELKTYRFYPHTSDDDDRTYRSREEVDEARRNDSLIVFANYLKGQGLIDDAGIEGVKAELKEQVDAEADAAWNAPDPEPESALRHVFAEREP